MFDDDVDNIDLKRHEINILFNNFVRIFDVYDNFFLKSLNVLRQITKIKKLKMIN